MKCLFCGAEMIENIESNIDYTTYVCKHVELYMDCWVGYKRGLLNGFSLFIKNDDLYFRISQGLYFTRLDKYQLHDFDIIVLMHIKKPLFESYDFEDYTRLMNKINNLIKMIIFV